MKQKNKTNFNSPNNSYICQTEEELNKAMRVHNPYLFSSINFVHNQQNIEEGIKHFKDKIDKIASVQFEDDYNKKNLMQDRLRRLKENKEKNNKENRNYSMSLDINKLMINKLLNNNDTQNKNMFNAAVSSANKKSITLNSPNSDNKPVKLKSLDNNLLFDHDFLKVYMLKDHILKKELLQLKKNKIFEFRSKYNKINKREKLSFLINNEDDSFSSVESEETQLIEPKLNMLSRVLNTDTIKLIRLERSDSMSTLEGFNSDNSNLNSKSFIFNNMLSKFTNNKEKLKILRDGSQLYDDIKKAESATVVLHKTISNKFKTFNSSISKVSKFVVLSKQENNQSLMQSALEEDKLTNKGKHQSQFSLELNKLKNLNLIQSPKLNSSNINLSKPKHSFDAISKIRDETAYKDKEMLMKKYNIKYNPEEFIFKLNNIKPKLKIQNLDVHSKVNVLLNKLNTKKSDLITRINNIKKSYI